MCVLDGSATMQEWLVWDKHPIRKHWDVIMDLGEGAFSQVVLARHKQTKKLAALKVVYLQSPDMDEEHLAVMRREAEFLQMLDSPRIVDCYEVVDDAKQQVLVLEYLRGGQLYDSLHRLAGSEEPYTEQSAAAIFAQMAEAVAFLHDYRIIHRDIKGENFVFVEDPHHAALNNRAPRVKLIDLGMAMLYNPDKPVTGALGSPGFVAPEAVHDAPHEPAMDIFSLGVVAFVMLVGRKPFSIQDSENLKYCEMDIKDAPGLKDQRWQDLSPSAKDLLMGMLAYNTKHRLTAQQVLQHDWVVTRGGTVPKPLNVNVTRGAANVAAVRRLRNLAHGVIAVNRLSAVLEPGDARKRAAANFSRSRATQEKSRGYRNDPSGRGITTLERVTLRATAANAARVHDRGGSINPDEDISVHYRTNRGFASQHGGSAYFGRRGSGSVHSSGDNIAAKSLKASGSAVMLSEMEKEGSWHGGGLMHPSQSMANLSRRSLTRRSSGPGAPRVMAALGSSIRGLADRSVHSGDSSRSSDADPSRSGRFSKRGSQTRLDSAASGSLHGGSMLRKGSGSFHGGNGMLRAGSGSLHGNGSAHGGRKYPDLSFEPSRKPPRHNVHRVSPLTEGRESLDYSTHSAAGSTPRTPSTAMQQEMERRAASIDD